LNRPRGLVLVFGVAGLVHFLRPRSFESMIPPAFPAPRFLVYASGAAELACAVGLARRRNWARAASAWLLVAVFPANVQMALDAGSGQRSGWADNRAILLARLPLQAVLVRAALRKSPRPLL
jgi:uncharacterized membrane protein